MQDSKGDAGSGVEIAGLIQINEGEIRSHLDEVVRGTVDRQDTRAGYYQRKALHVKPVKKPKPFAPTIRKVKEIVPNKFVAKLKPATSIQPATRP